MTKLIAGLGNPGQKYQNTRHNLGFILVDYLSEELSEPNVYFFKNSRFMNEAGLCVKTVVHKKGIELSNLLIIHDDLDLPLGEFRLQCGRSSAGHKGVQSVVDELGSQDFWRLRIGIDHPPEGMETNDYVTGQLTPTEQETIKALFPQITSTIQEWLLN